MEVKPNRTRGHNEPKPNKNHVVYVVKKVLKNLNKSVDNHKSNTFAWLAHLWKK